MHFWHSLLTDVTRKEIKARNTTATQLPQVVCKSIASKEARDLRMYYLGDQYPNVYLTKREAECMFWLVQDNTINATAIKMNLSARTVEFYVKKMKLKLLCVNKKQLIHKVLQTPLLKALEADGLSITKH
jgi:DNA-binding CsgD family transcriptional regulator